MLKPHKAMDKEVAKLADIFADEIKVAAMACLQKRKNWTSFAASMGTVSFYDHHGPVDDDRLPKDAQAVVAFANQYQDYFGSAGVQISKED